MVTRNSRLTVHFGEASTSTVNKDFKQTESAMKEVRSTRAWVAAGASHAGIEKVVEAMEDSIPNLEWDFEGIHYFDNAPLTVQLLVLDSLNLCFWPVENINRLHQSRVGSLDRNKQMGQINGEF